ncbi:helix-turn-helix transcriptional regulator [Eggerthellaceae bacterium 3-80]|nr:LuxR family transcriptional regulator [bacterium D16-34]
MQSSTKSATPKSHQSALGDTFRTFKNTLFTYPALWIGFACICAWPWSCTSATLVYPGAVAVGTPLWLGSNLTYLIIGLGGLLIACFPFKLNRQSLTYSVPFVAACCYSAASAIFIALCKLPTEQLMSNYAALTLLWPLLAGIGQIIVFVSWIDAFGRLGSRKTVALVVLGSLLGTGLLYLLNFIPQSIRELVPLTIGLVASFCTYFSYKKPESLQSDFVGFNTADNPKDNQQFTISHKRRPPWKLLISALTAGFAFGIFQGISFSGGFGSGAWYDYGVIGFFLAAFLFALCALPLRMNFNHLIYRVSFVLMALGSLLCIMLTQDAAWGYEVFCVGYRFFDVLIWCLCAYLVHHRSASSAWLGGLCMGTLLLGRFMGFELFGIWDAYFVNESLSVLLALVLFLLMLIALYLVSQTNLREAWGMVQPGEFEDEASLLAYCCTQIAQSYALSAREYDVLAQLAQGKSRIEVSQALVLSEETIKTHIRRLYQKLDIHSRKELEHLLTAQKQNARFGRIDLTDNNATQ